MHYIYFDCITYSVAITTSSWMKSESAFENLKCERARSQDLRPRTRSWSIDPEHSEQIRPIKLLPQGCYCVLKIAKDFRVRDLWNWGSPADNENGMEKNFATERHLLCIQKNWRIKEKNGRLKILVVVRWIVNIWYFKLTRKTEGISFRLLLISYDILCIKL